MDLSCCLKDIPGEDLIDPLRLDEDALALKGLQGRIFPDNDSNKLENVESDDDQYMFDSAEQSLSHDDPRGEVYETENTGSEDALHLFHLNHRSLPRDNLGGEVGFMTRCSKINVVLMRASQDSGKNLPAEKSLLKTV